VYDSSLPSRWSTSGSAVTQVVDETLPRRLWGGGRRPFVCSECHIRGRGPCDPARFERDRSHRSGHVDSSRTSARRSGRRPFHGSDADRDGEGQARQWRKRAQRSYTGRGGHSGFTLQHFGLGGQSTPMPRKLLWRTRAQRARARTAFPAGPSAARRGDSSTARRSALLRRDREDDGRSAQQGRDILAKPPLRSSWQVFRGVDLRATLRVGKPNALNPCPEGSRHETQGVRRGVAERITGGRCRGARR